MIKKKFCFAIVIQNKIKQLDLLYLQLGVLYKASTKCINISKYNI